jgi:hypothetical protein
MQATTVMVVGAGLGALLATPMSVQAKATDTQTTSELQQEIKTLQDQLNALQRRLDAQAADEQKAKSEAAAAQSAAAAATAATSAATAAIPGEVQAAVDAAKPKTDKIYYKGLSITLGGFVEMAPVYRERNQNNDISSAYNSIPFQSVSTADTSQLVFTERQSRFSALVAGDVDPSTHLSLYSEFDFQGAAQTANSKESNSYNPRVRHLFAAADWDDLGLHVLAGQAWSLATMNSNGITFANTVYPPTIDGQYMPGYVWARQPQLRVVKDFDQQLWLGLSLENPQTTFYTGADALPKDVILVDGAAGTGLGFNESNTYSLNHVPDVIGKIAYEIPLADRKVHVEGFGLFSEFSTRLDYQNQKTSGGGWGAGLVLPVVPHLLDFQVSGLAGKGIGRYGSGQLTEVTFDPAGNMQPIHEVIALAGLTLHATPTFDVYVFAGEDKESAQSYDLVAADGTVTPYGYGNPLYSNSGCYGETAKTTCTGNERLVEQLATGVWYKPYVGAFGTVRLGAEWAHTQFDTFEGKGGAPTVIQNAVFLSFRYYPFQQ